jgi:hypothetical protein
MPVISSKKLPNRNLQKGNEQEESSRNTITRKEKKKERSARLKFDGCNFIHL